MEEVVNRIKELREDRGLSVEKLAELTGLAHASISRWENGLTDIRSKEIKILCKFFNVTADYLICLSDF